MKPAGDDPRRVLITGAAGRIGTMLRARLASPGRTLVVLDTRAMGACGPQEELVSASVTDRPALAAAAAGCDAIVHLGGLAGESTWAEIDAVNNVGTFNVFDVARTSGVRRVVFASSNHAVGYTRRPADGRPLADDAPMAPDTYYGVSKVMGEALGSLHHHRYGIDSVCLRILSCRDEPDDLRCLATWLSPDDCGRLFEAALTTPAPGFRLVWGVSANTRSWFSTDGGRAIGYHPADDAEPYAAALIARLGPPDLAATEHSLVGGVMAGPAFDAIDPR